VRTTVRVALVTAILVALGAGTCAVGGVPQIHAGSAPAGWLFRGNFESGTYKPFSTPECANYHQPPSPTRTFGNFFVVTSRSGQGHQSGRFDLPADTAKLTRCEMFSRRGIGIGADDWYSLMLFLPKGWTAGTNAFWGVEVAQLNFENVWGAPVALEVHADHVTLAVQAGRCSVLHCAWSTNADRPGHGDLPPLYAIPRKMKLGVWHELIVHVHWALDQSGRVAVWHRLLGRTQWAETVSLHGIPTVQTRDDGSYPVNTLDKIGAYRAQSTAPTSVWLDGFSRSRSFAAAAGNLP
jgi:hypothetical protein